VNFLLGVMSRHRPGSKESLGFHFRKEQPSRAHGDVCAVGRKHFLIIRSPHNRGSSKMA
jgi:hypothetical protein